jgi:hypothetical protein
LHALDRLVEERGLDSEEILRKSLIVSDMEKKLFSKKKLVGDKNPGFFG